MKLCKGRGRQRGAELLEFTFVLLPLLSVLFVLLDISWGIFAKGTLQHAVRLAVRQGVTITAAQTGTGQCLTDMVKTAVQSNSRGLLNGSSGLAKIKVHYFQPPAANSTGPVTDVSTLSSGNTPGNVIQVSVEGYPLTPLVPRLFDWKTTPDKSATALTVFSADTIEPSRNPPCIGTAP